MAGGHSCGVRTGLTLVSGSVELIPCLAVARDRANVVWSGTEPEGRSSSPTGLLLWPACRGVVANQDFTPGQFASVDCGGFYLNV